MLVYILQKSTVKSLEPAIDCNSLLNNSGVDNKLNSFPRLMLIAHILG